MNLWKRVRHLWALFRYSGTEYALRCGVKVGKGCRIISRHFGTEPFLINIGDRVTVADGVRFLTHDGAHWLIRDDAGRRYHFGRIDIGDDVFIGAGAIILPRVKIGCKSIVAAGSVVTKSIPSGSIVAGVPAKIIGSFDEFEARSLATAPSDRDRNRDNEFEKWVLSAAAEGFAPEMSREEIKATVEKLSHVPSHHQD